MNPFSYARAQDSADAIRLAGAHATTKFLGGGTNLVDLMRENIEAPTALVDVTGFSTAIEETAAGGLRIGAGVKNTALAENRAVRERYPALTRAILTGASGQIRNMATVAGNIMQRTRCTYFYDEAARCNKRSPGQGCDAIDGFNRIHAILGASPSCVATHPSDMCVALIAFDATVHVEGPNGTRMIPLVDFHRLPGGQPDLESELAPGELITAIELPRLPMAARSTYRKVRDRASYAFALVSVAGVVEVKDGVVASAALAFGGLGPMPWRNPAVEAAIVGRAPSTEAFEAAADALLADAKGYGSNDFKIPLARRTLIATLRDLTA